MSSRPRGGVCKDPEASTKSDETSTLLMTSRRRGGVCKDPEAGAAALQRCSGAELPEWARDEWNYVACKMYVACLPYTAWELQCRGVYTARRGESSATGGTRSAGRGGPRGLTVP